MDEQKIILDFIAAQLAQLHASAVANLPEGSPAIEVLSRAVAEIHGAVREPVLPDGFDQATYDAFLEEQVNAVFPDSTVEEMKANITDVIGVVQDADGQYVEVGNVEQATAGANDLVATFEEENGEILTDRRIVITYERLNGEILTETNVHEIINHPTSASLDKFGNIQLLEIADTDKANTKQAVFFVVEEGVVSLKALALSVAAYRGRAIFPRIGAVSAVAEPINFDLD